MRVLPSGKTSTVAKIAVDGKAALPAVTGSDITTEKSRTGERQDEAVAGESVTICLADEVDCSRGDVISLADNPPQAADQFESTIVWLSDDPLHVGRAYWLKLGTQTVSVTVHQPKYAVNVNTHGAYCGQDA